jgi:hypothetical protein
MREHALYELGSERHHTRRQPLVVSMALQNLGGIVPSGVVLVERLQRDDARLASDADVSMPSHRLELSLRSLSDVAYIDVDLTGSHTEHMLYRRADGILHGQADLDHVHAWLHD